MTVAGPGVRALAGGLVALVLAVDPAAAQGPPYLDPTLPVERRIDDLLARMTLEEKVGQMLCLWQGKRAITDSQGRFDPSRPPRWFRIGIGRIEDELLRCCLQVAEAIGNRNLDIPRPRRTPTRQCWCAMKMVVRDGAVLAP